MMIELCHQLIFWLEEVEVNYGQNVGDLLLLAFEREDFVEEALKLKSKNLVLHAWLDAPQEHLELFLFLVRRVGLCQ